MTTYPRYPAYKDSGVARLGCVPEHWDITPLKYLASVNDDVLPENTPAEYAISYVEISSVDADHGIVSVAELTFGDAPSRAKRQVRDGDIIVSTVRTYLGAIARIQNPAPNLVVSTGFAVIRPISTMHSHFIGYVCSASYFIETVIANSVGVSYPAINSSDLIRIALALPPLPEQAAIAAFLDRETAQLDTLIARQERLIALLGEKRQALISHAVTKGLDPAAPMKDSGVPWLGAIPAHWEVKPIKYLVSMASGSTPNKDHLAYWNGDIPWASAKDLKVEDLYDTEDHITEAAIKDSAVRVLDKQVVIIVVRGMILAHTLPVAINMIPMAINQDLKALIPDDRTNVRFLAWQLRGLARIFLARADTAGHGTKALRVEDWNDIELVLPSLEEQLMVVKHIESNSNTIDTLIAKAQNAIALLRERRTALIAAAVTGQIDVRDVLAQRPEPPAAPAEVAP